MSRAPGGITSAAHVTPAKLETLRALARALGATPGRPAGGNDGRPRGSRAALGTRGWANRERGAVATTVLPVPAAPVPVPSQVGRVLRHHHHVVRPWGDEALATGADVGLAGGVRLDRRDHFGFGRAFPAHPPSSAHATTAAVASTARTTIATSTVVPLLPEGVEAHARG